MKRSIPGALLLACACAHSRPAPVASRPAGPAQRLLEVPPAVIYKEARELMARSEWDAAKVRLDAYLAREPKNPAAQFDAGYLAEKRGDQAAAQDAYRRALRLDPGHVGAALNLARLLPAPDAEPVLRAALEKHDGDPALLDALAGALRGQNKLAQAEAVARKVLERHPKDALAWRVLAAIEADRGHVRLAESALQNARKLAPEDAGIVNSLGLLAMRRDDVVAARALFEEATRLGPSLAAPWSNLGAVALRYRDYAAAETAYARAVALEGSAPVRLGHAWALEGLRRFKEARGEYEQVLAAQPRDVDALFGRAVALKAEGDLPSSLQAFKDYLALDGPPKAADARTQVASLEARLKAAPQQPPGVQDRAETAAPPAKPDVADHTVVTQ